LVDIKSTFLRKITLFAKTILSVLAFGIVIIGLLQFFSSGEYLTFAIGMALYFVVAISGAFLKRVPQ
jgi:hypothetical protein